MIAKTAKIPTAAEWLTATGAAPETGTAGRISVTINPTFFCYIKTV